MAKYYKINDLGSSLKDGPKFRRVFSSQQSPLIIHLKDYSVDHI